LGSEDSSSELYLREGLDNIAWDND
jgi:hypothetical protein